MQPAQKIKSRDERRLDSSLNHLPLGFLVLATFGISISFPCVLESWMRLRVTVEIESLAVERGLLSGRRPVVWISAALSPSASRWAFPSCQSQGTKS